MKVLHVMAGAAKGGAETAFIDTCLALKEAGLDIEVAARGNDRNQNLIDAGIRVYTLPFGGVADLYTKWRMKKIIGAFKPVIVQTWMSRASVKTPASGNPKTYLKVSRLGGYYGLKYYRDTDYFIGNTPDIRDYLVREGVSADKAVQINNFAPAEKAATPVSRASLDTPDDAIVVLTLARLHENKALDVLIRSVRDLANIHVWIAGEGPLEQELKALSVECGVEERIHFLGWREDRAGLMAACDICAVPSRHEPFGNVFVQAWANEVPLVTSASEGPRQYVRDNEDALVFAIDDCEAMTKILERLSGDADLRARLGRAGYQRYSDEFTKEKTVAAYLKFYDDIARRESLIR